MFVVTGGRLEDSEAALERVLEVQVHYLRYPSVQDKSTVVVDLASVVHC